MFNRFLKFGLVGVLATLSHYAVMFAGLALWHVPVFWSFAGAVVGAVVGYLLNYIYTFESNLPHRQTTWRYSVITILSILLNTAIFFALFRLVGLPVLWAQLTSTALVFICNYFAHKNVTFDEKAARSS
ncbi:MAG: GtrA family protein [Pseudomonadota bacterium]